MPIVTRRSLFIYIYIMIYITSNDIRKFDMEFNLLKLSCKFNYTSTNHSQLYTVKLKSVKCLIFQIKHCYIFLLHGRYIYHSHYTSLVVATINIATQVITIRRDQQDEDKTTIWLIDLIIAKLSSQHLATSFLTTKLNFVDRVFTNFYPPKNLVYIAHVHNAIHYI